MFFRQILHEDLGCASYIVAAGGEAAVVGPKWEIEEYLEIAEGNGFRISHILETHNHGDHLSGRGRLREATGATIHVSRDAGVEYEHEPISDGDRIEAGGTRITTLATPGHRPEHTAFLVRDTGRAESPWLVFTGDSLFVGDLARPDLAVEPEEGVRGIFGSLRRLLELEDFVEVWPGHVGGSLCGCAGMSQKPGSNVGFERRFNPYLRIEDEEEFVQTLTAEQAPQPPNFGRIVELNRDPLLTEPAPLEPVLPERVRQLIEAGAVVIDGRVPREFDAAHIPGSINVTTAKEGVGTRAAWVADPETEIVAAASDDGACRMARMLEAVGFCNLCGYLAGGAAAWREAGLEVQTTAAIDVPTLAGWLKRGEVDLLDVRSEAEWRTGYVSGSLHVPYQRLREGVPDEIRDGDKPVAVACSAGNRSSIAASLLRRAGLDGIEHLADGGVADLQGEGGMMPANIARTRAGARPRRFHRRGREQSGES